MAGMHILLGGATPAGVRLTNHSVWAHAAGPSGPISAQARIEFNSSGSLILTPPGGSVPGEWLAFGVSSAYEIRVTMSSGTGWAGDSLSTWLNLGTTRTWSLSANRASGQGATIVTGVATVEIRRAVDSVVVASAVIDLTAIAEIVV